MRVTAQFRYEPFVPVRYDTDTGRWVVVRDLDVLIAVPSFLGRVRIPQGRRTDGASVPRVLWSVLGHPLTGDVYPAAIVHDELYLRGLVTRREADAVFYVLLCRVLRPGFGSRARAFVYWLGVRAGGWVGWWRHRADER